MPTPTTRAARPHEIAHRERAEHVVDLLIAIGAVDPTMRDVVVFALWNALVDGHAQGFKIGVGYGRSLPRSRK